MVIKIGLFFFQESDDSTNSSSSDKKPGKGRTGWPEHVWASELKTSPKWSRDNIPSSIVTGTGYLTCFGTSQYWKIDDTPQSSIGFDNFVTTDNAGASNQARQRILRVFQQECIFRVNILWQRRLRPACINLYAQMTSVDSKIVSKALALTGLCGSQADQSLRCLCMRKEFFICVKSLNFCVIILMNHSWYFVIRSPHKKSM